MSPKAGTKVVVEQEAADGEITSEEIAIRAYAIHLSGSGGDELEDWLRAERELFAELHPEDELEAEQEPEPERELEQEVHIAA